MHNLMKHLILTLALAAFSLVAAGSAAAQTKDETKADQKVTTQSAGKNMSCCDDKASADKASADKKECADKDCCKMDKAGSHDKAQMEKMHGKMSDAEMKEMMEKMEKMHGKMDSKEMKAMHEKMMKEMKEDTEKDKGEKEEKDDDDDDDGLL